MKKPPTPAEMVAAIVKTKDLPAKVEAAALALLDELGAERTDLYRRANKAANTLGETSQKLRRFGVSYAQQAALIGVHRNTMYHNRGPAELGPVTPRPGQQERAMATLEKAAAERAQAQAALKDNSEGMSELVRYLYTQFRVPIAHISERSGVKRPTLYGWLGLARHTAAPDGSGRLTRSLKGDGYVTPQPRQPGATGGGTARKTSGGKKVRAK